MSVKGCRLKLLYSLKSPFARKVRVAAFEKGVELTLVEGHPINDPPELLAANPLGKVPALISEDGTAYYDSKVICEYIESLNDSPCLIPYGRRLEVLNQAAIGDGLMDAAVAIVMERMRPEDYQYGAFIDRQKEKIRRTMIQLKERPTDGLTLGTISLAVAVQYMRRRSAELREAVEADASAEFLQWCDKFAKRPSMIETDFPEG